MLMIRECLALLSFCEKFVVSRVQIYLPDNIHSSSCNIPRYSISLVLSLIDTFSRCLDIAILPYWLIFNLAKSFSSHGKIVGAAEFKSIFDRNGRKTDFIYFLHTREVFIEVRISWPGDSAPREKEDGINTECDRSRSIFPCQTYRGVGLKRARRFSTAALIY